MIMKKMKLAGYVARMGEMSNAYNGSVENIEARDHLEDLGVDGRVLLKVIFETYFVDWMYLLLDMGPVTQSCEDSSEHSGPVNGGRFID
jgi:hypothetical protein